MKKFILFVAFFAIFVISNPVLAIEAPILTATQSIDAGTTLVTLYWPDISNADKYMLYYALYPYTASDKIYEVNLGVLNTLLFDLSNCPPVYVGVRAFNGQEVSGFSNIELIIVNPQTTTTPQSPQDNAWNNLKGTWSYCEYNPGSTVSLKMLRIYSINSGYDKDAFPYKEEVQFAAGYGNTTCSGSPAQTWSDYTLSDEVFDIITNGSATEFQLIYHYSSTNVLIQNGGNEMLYGKGSLMDPVIFLTRE